MDAGWQAEEAVLHTLELVWLGKNLGMKGAREKPNVMLTGGQRPKEGWGRDSGRRARCPGIHLPAHLSPLPALIPASIRVRRELGWEVPSDKHLVGLLL